MDVDVWRHCVIKDMKQNVRWILASGVACAICSLITARIAYHRGYESGYNNGVVTTIGHCNFGQSIGALAALQKLRAGDVPDATRLLERVCFDSAHIFYKEPNPTGEVSKWGRAVGLAKYPDAATTKSIAQELSKYRATYRTNRADWDEMERKLEVELANVK